MLPPFSKTPLHAAITVIETQNRLFIEMLKRLVRFEPNDGEKSIQEALERYWGDISDADLEILQHIFFRTSMAIDDACRSRGIEIEEAGFGLSYVSPEDVAGELKYDPPFLMAILAELAGAGFDRAEAWIEPRFPGLSAYPLSDEGRPGCWRVAKAITEAVG